MTSPSPRLHWRPSYLRRAPRWHDGAARLLDLGGTFDLQLPPTDDGEAIAEDWRMVSDDLHRAIDQLREHARELNA